MKRIINELLEFQTEEWLMVGFMGIMLTVFTVFVLTAYEAWMP